MHAILEYSCCCIKKSYKCRSIVDHMPEFWPDGLSCYLALALVWDEGHVLNEGMTSNNKDTTMSWLGGQR